MIQKVRKYGFKIAYQAQPISKRRLIKAEIMSALNIKNPMTFSRRSNGTTVPRLDEAEIIEEVFAKHGVFSPWNYEYGKFSE